MRSHYRIGVVLKTWTSHSLQVVSGLIAHQFADADVDFLDWGVDAEFDAALVAARINQTKPDGVVLQVDAVEYSRLRQGVSANVPMVNVGASLDDTSTPSVTLDPDRLSGLLSSHLAPLGGHSVGYVFDERLPCAVRQAESLDGQVKQQGLSLQRFTEACPTNSDEPSESRNDPDLEHWLRDLEKPTNIVCSQGSDGQRVIAAAKAIGCNVPRDVRVVSLIDERICLFTSPPQTSIRLDGYRLGAAAISSLESLLNGGAPPSSAIDVDADGITLIARGSTIAGGPMADPIQWAIDYIERHACDRINVEDVLKNTPVVARTRFYALFTERTGLAPASFIRNTRVRRAAELILQSNFTLTHIAETTGFSSASQLSTSFGRVMGCSPSEYRKQGRTS